MADEIPISRRRFLKQSFAFSAAAMLAGCGTGIVGGTSDQDPVNGGIYHILMVGDYGEPGATTDQSNVATAMKNYVANRKISTDALLMLGDNFYGDMPGGVSSPRWQTQFEQMYPASVFNCPAYAIPGNHDYQNSPQSKFEAQLAYAAKGNTRWTMPARYYTFLFPAQNPLVTFIALDSNMPNEPAQPYPPDPSYYTPTDTQRTLQLQWFQQVLQQPLTTPYLVVMGHHPLYSNGVHGDNQTLINDWDPLLRHYGVHLYLGGHDHDLQHIELEGHPTSFVLSGAGGAKLAPLQNGSVAARGPFGQEVHGFTHLQIRAENMILRHLDDKGNLLHKFTKAPDGKVAILK